MARILVIDDDAEMRSMLSQTLSVAGHEVALAEDGKQGMKEHRATPADLVITDIFMPEKDGIEVIMELRRDFPKLLIIAMSGNPAGMNLLNITQKLGVARILEKPFQPGELLTTVEDVLKSGRA